MTAATSAVERDDLDAGHEITRRRADFLREAAADGFFLDRGVGPRRLHAGCGAGPAGV